MYICIIKKDTLYCFQDSPQVVVYNKKNTCDPTQS